MSYIKVSETISPDTPAAGKIIFYAKSDGLLYYMNDTGIEIAVSNSDASKLQGFDITTTDPADREILIFDSVANEWVTYPYLDETHLYWNDDGNVLSIGQQAYRTNYGNGIQIRADSSTPQTYAYVTIRALIEDSANHAQIGIYDGRESAEGIPGPLLANDAAGSMFMGGYHGTGTYDVHYGVGFRGYATEDQTSTNFGTKLLLSVTETGQNTPLNLTYTFEDGDFSIPGIYNGDGGGLTNLNAAKIQDFSVSTTDPNTGDALIYDSVATEYVPSSLLNVLGGDGSDGNVNIAAGTTTLARDMMYDTLTLADTARLNTANFRVFANKIVGPVAGMAYISCNGATGGAGGNAALNVAGAAGAAGAAIAAGSMPASIAGTAGTIGAAGRSASAGNGTAGGGGVAGAAITTVAGVAGVAGQTNAAGKGGNAGAYTGGSGGAGGAGGGITALTAAQGSIKNVISVLKIQTNAQTETTFNINSASGGSGSGGSGATANATGTSGGGGGSGGEGSNGGYCVVVTKQIVNGTYITIESNGGTGGKGGNGGNAGATGNNGGGQGGAGGSGGSGGLACLIYSFARVLPTIRALGGTAGAKGTLGNGTGTGLPGTDGVAGKTGVAGMTLTFKI